MKFGFREVVVTSLMLGMVAGTYAMIVQPHASARRQRIAELRSMDAELSVLGNSTRDLEDLARRVDQQRRTVTQFANMLPQETEAEKSLNEVMQTAAANSLQAGGARLMKREQHEGLIGQAISLELTGNFNGFYSFLLQLEATHRVMRVTQLNFRDSGAPDGQINADMTLMMFFNANPGNFAQIE